METGCFGVEGLEIAAFPGASSAVLGGLRADGHGLSEPGVLLLLSSSWCNCCSWCWWWCFHWWWSWYSVSVTVVVCGGVGGAGVAVAFDAAVALAVFVSDMAVAVATTAVHVQDDVPFALSWIVALRMRKTLSCTADDVQQ